MKSLIFRTSVMFIFGYVCGFWITFFVWKVLVDPCEKAFGWDWKWNGSVCVNKVEGSIRFFR